MTAKQTRAARRNIRKAQAAAKRKRTIAHLPESTRRSLGQEAAKGRSRGGEAGHALEQRNRQQLYDTARKLGIEGRSKMGKWELIDAIRAAR
jgi:Rho termination factor, N-terminal domain